MAWSDPGDFTSGQILTAAQMDSIREAMFFGQGTFANEAARDTAYNAAGAMSPITLQEGMRAYLTASTVAAATGANTAVPTGITTVYNGSSWVCTTEVGAYTDTTGTTSAVAFTPTLSGGGTNPSVTLTTGTTALVMYSMNATINASPHTASAGVAVSGATTLAVGTTAGSAAIAGTNYVYVISHVVAITGLTAGVNTFTLQYQVSNAGVSGSFSNRHLVVKGIA
jgi:hypothetical protein